MLFISEYAIAAPIAEAIIAIAAPTIKNDVVMAVKIYVVCLISCQLYAIIDKTLKTRVLPYAHLYGVSNFHTPAVCFFYNLQRNFLLPV